MVIQLPKASIEEPSSPAWLGGKQAFIVGCGSKQSLVPSIVLVCLRRSFWISQLCGSDCDRLGLRSCHEAGSRAACGGCGRQSSVGQFHLGLVEDVVGTSEENESQKVRLQTLTETAGDKAFRASRARRLKPCELVPFALFSGSCRHGFGELHTSRRKC